MDRPRFRNHPETETSPASHPGPPSPHDHGRHRFHGGMVLVRMAGHRPKPALPPLTPGPAGAERTNVDSYGYSGDDSFITPPEAGAPWRSTTSTTTTRNTWPNSISRGLSGEWQHCVRDLVPGLWLVKDNVLVGVDTANAPLVKGPGSFEIHVDQHYVRNPCDR